MGTNQSKTPLLNEKLVIERLRALELKDGADNDYEYVDVEEKDEAAKKKAFRAPWNNLSVGEVETWEHELLQDPKNRLAASLLLLCSSPTISIYLSNNASQTCTLRPVLRRPQDRPPLSLNANQRSTDLQREDPI